MSLYIMYVDELISISKTVVSIINVSAGSLSVVKHKENSQVIQISLIFLLSSDFMANIGPKPNNC